MSAKILITFGLICIGGLVSGTPVPSSSGLFAADLFKQISKDKLNENIIISPISVQAAMAMAFVGSEGETATELQKGLRLSSSSKDVVGQEFSKVLNAKKDDGQITIANKIYVGSRFKLRSTYNDLLSKYFNSEAESVEFADNVAAVENVNNWIAKATNDKITNVLQPDSVDGDTLALIVNAISFNGKWQTPFVKVNTRTRNFWISKTESVKTKLMMGVKNVLFGELPELGATGIEVPYADSDLSLLILLPNERDGLGNLEDKLASVALTDLSSQMSEESVLVLLPKFKIEFGTSLKDVLKLMGMKSVFGNANFSGMLEDDPKVYVSNVVHKAFIEVDEEGSKAGAATVVDMDQRSEPKYSKVFAVDHPFVYAIKSSDTVYFVGHYSQPIVA